MFYFIPLLRYLLRQHRGLLDQFFHALVEAARGPALADFFPAMA
jgi:hypothetical protein